MKHHLTILGTPICELTGVTVGEIACNHLTETRAKIARLRLIEQNPRVPIQEFGIAPGVCPAVSKISEEGGW